MITVAALATIIIVVGLLILDKVSPIAALCLVPFVAAIAVGFGLEEISEFFESGLGRVAGVATMFMFAILFFGVLQDAGLFQPAIDAIIKWTGGNIVLVVVGTAIVGMLAHLDGAGATTFLLTIPALFPLYRRLKINPLLMLLVLATGAGIFNMLPWAGPLGRAAAVTGFDVSELWRPLIPVQISGAILLVVTAALLGARERRRIKSSGSSPSEVGSEVGISGQKSIAEESGADKPVPKRLIINLSIFLVVMGLLLSGMLPAGLVFMLGLSTALTVNHPTVQGQLDQLRTHAPPAIMMAAIILSAGVFLGIMDGSGMLRALSQSLVNFLPESALPYLHIIIGFFGLPLELVLSTDAYYFGLLPVVLDISTSAGTSAQGTVYALMIGNIIGTFISPFSPALWLALGLSGQDMGKHIRYSLPIMWAFSIALFIVAWSIGLFQ